MQSVTKHFRKFAMNRIGLALFYFWLGCFVMGGMGDVDTWTKLSHATGITAFVVGFGDLCVSCCAESMDSEDDERLANASERKDAPPKTVGRPAAEEGGAPTA